MASKPNWKPHELVGFGSKHWYVANIVPREVSMGLKNRHFIDTGEYATNARGTKKALTR